MNQTHPIQALRDNLAMVSSIHTVGYSVLRFGSPMMMEVCIVMPAIEEIGAIAVDADGRKVEVKGLHATLTLPELPIDVSRLAAIDPSRILLVAVDTLSIPRSACRLNVQRAQQGAEKPSPSVLFNEFLNSAVKSGGFSVEHRRIRSRQPESEVFVRKSMFVVEQLTKGIQIDVKKSELRIGYANSGREYLADAAVDFLTSHPALARYLDEPISPTSSGSPALPVTDLFSVLHAYAFHEMGAGLGASTSFGSLAAAAAVALSGQTGRIRERVLRAADSVFAQSFADVHAIALCAAFDGAAAANLMLSEVRRRRTAGGDFENYSLAALSHDTSSALDLLADDLRRNQDHHLLTRDQLWGRSLWMASESLGAWLAKHGTPQDVIAAVLQALEAHAQIAVFASGGIGRDLGTKPH
ncbi:hypothetical protein ABIC83_002613 [Roseateles asaccharophilus]|uniref:hypothetical protein n=1 Tax=Roseateles asaccharophilus TaxID=582607 RepID=UPI003838B74F